jgi:GST-like protein
VTVAGALEFYGAATGNCLRAVMALEEAGIPYVTRIIDLKNGEHKRSPYTDLNPAGLVPTIVDQLPDGSQLVLTQSNAIILYAAGKAPGRLMPQEEGAAKSIVFERFLFFITDVIGPSGASFYLKGRKQDEAAGLLDARMRNALIGAERFAQESRFMAGDDFSIADIAGFTITKFAKPHLPWSDLPNLQRWYQAVECRPAVLRAYKALGMDG